MRKCFVTTLTFTLLYGCKQETAQEEIEDIPVAIETVPEINYIVIGSFPHDTISYTQGLLFHKKQILESTGSPQELRQTRSVVGVFDTLNGKIAVKAELDRNLYFGEGIASLNNKIYQLTYKNQTGFVYDAASFKKLKEFNFESKEGWGLTSNDSLLIMSDGSHILTFIDPTDFQVRRKLKVTNNGYTQEFLNELEFIEGFIYANVYCKNYIVKIDPSNGKVVGILDLSPLVSQAQHKSRSSEVLNGIAYEKETKNLLVTGKMWPTVFKIRLVE